MEELHKLDKFMGPPTSIPLLGLSLYNQMVRTTTLVTITCDSHNYDK